LPDGGQHREEFALAGYFFLALSEFGLQNKTNLLIRRIVVPSCQKADALMLSRDEAEPLGQSETILVVEDDKALRELTAKLLRDGGYRVIEAKDGEGALRIMATPEAGIDLLLTDVIMPEKSGPELVKQVEKGHPKTGFVFMLGYSDDMVKRHGLLMQEDSFLEKPFTKRSLLRKVYSTLHRESERQQDI
jgi:CheY-like chemotaxis protein